MKLILILQPKGGPAKTGPAGVLSPALYSTASRGDRQWAYKVLVFPT